MAIAAPWKVFGRIKTAFMSFLLVAPLMVIALAAASLAPDAASAQERNVRQATDTPLQAASGFHARLKALEQKAAGFRPDGAPLRAKASVTSKRAKAATSGAKPMPQTREHVLLGRQVSSHKAAIGKLRARLDAFEKEARGHEVGHQLGDSGSMAGKKKTRRPGERVNNPQYGAGLDAKSKKLDRDIAVLEAEARQIYKRPGRTK